MMNSSMHRGIAAILAIWLAASACQLITGALQPPTVSTQDIVYTATTMAFPTQVSTVPPPTEPVAPTPTPTIVHAPTAEELTWFPSTDSHCRAGPGIQYASLTVLWSGQRLSALGTDEGWNWVEVRMQLSNNTCWTRSETGNLSGDMNSLPIIHISKPVPTATLPKPFASGSDVDVLRVGASALEGRDVIYMDIRNNGPNDFTGLVRLVCAGQSKLRDTPYTQERVSQDDYVDVTIYAGLTGTINSTLETDTASYSYPVIQCTISVPNNLDPNPKNNTGATAIP